MKLNVFRSGWVRGSTRVTTAVAALSRLCIAAAAILLLTSCSSQVSHEEPLGKANQALTPVGYSFTFGLTSITIGQATSELVQVHYDLEGAINSLNVSEVFECNNTNTLNIQCDRGRVVRLPDDLENIGSIGEFLIGNNIRPGTFGVGQTSIDLRLSIKKQQGTVPEDPVVVDLHVELADGTITATAFSGTITSLTNSCVASVGGWSYCWAFHLPCKSGETSVSCTSSTLPPDCNALFAHGTASCTNRNPGPCGSLVCGLAWDLVEADPTTTSLFPPAMDPVRDLNGFKLNPRWGWQSADLPVPPTFVESETSQPHEVDNPNQSIFGTIPYTCNSGVLGQDGIGHLNWNSEAVTYHGNIFWSGHACIGPPHLPMGCQDFSPDDDFNLNFQTQKSHGFPSGITVANGTIPDGEFAILLEFKWSEILNRFSTPNIDSYWSRFVDDVMLGDPTDLNPAGINGTEAFVIGLMGLDREHDAHSEIHPVWALALHTDTDPSNDTWHFFVRNYGNEGWCSHEQHYLGNAPYDIKIQLARPPSAVLAKPAVLLNIFAGNTGTAPPVLSRPDNDNAFVTFHMPAPPAHGLGHFWRGQVQLNWVNASPPFPGPHPLAQAQVAQVQAAPSASAPADDLDAEEQIIELILALTPEQRQTYHTVLSSLTPPLPPTDEVAVEATGDTTRPAQATALPPVVAVEDPSLADHRLNVVRALCGSLNGQIPADKGTCAQVPPSTLLTTTGGATGQNGWVVSSLTVTLAPVDSTGKGIARTEYSFDGVTFTTYSQPFIAPEGTITISYRSTDNLGNVEPANQQSFKIDTRAPSSSASASVQTDHVALSFAVSDPTPGSGAAGLHSVSKVGNTSQFVTQFTPGQSGQVLLNTTCTDIEYWGQDVAGNQESPHQHIADTTPPSLAVSPTAFCMWPPNHRRVRFTLGTDFSATATDACDSTPSMKIVSVTSNESDDGLGDGDTAGDVSFGPSSFCVRRERSGSGDGRVYTVVVEATDSSGNAARQQITVTVPHSGNNKKTGCSEGGVEIADNVPCE